MFELGFYMEANKEEGLKAKEIAEKRFAEKDFAGAKTYALKAKALYPGLEGISQMVATFEVYFASELRCNGEVDYYSILGLKPSADKEALKKQYRRMAVLLHPDKNKCIGADGAFKLVSEAWTSLSHSFKKSSYDRKTNKQFTSGVVQTNLSSTFAGVTGVSTCPNSVISHGRLDTFWTVCTSCKVQYEYLRKYLNKRLSCKNCRGTFVAIETGAAPVNGSFPYSPWTYVPTNGYASHGFDGVTYVPTSTTHFTGNGSPGYHSGHRYEYVSNVSFQWNAYSGTSPGIVDPNGASTISPGSVYKATNGDVRKGSTKVQSGANGKHCMKATTTNIVFSNGFNGHGAPSGIKAGGPEKKRKVISGINFKNGYEEKSSKYTSESGVANGNPYIHRDIKLCSPNELPSRRFAATPSFDTRKILMDKAKIGIQKKLQEMRLATKAVPATIAVKGNGKESSEGVQPIEVGESSKRHELIVSGYESMPRASVPKSISVPDPDFHDFDRDRSEQCFKPRQIWAIYDEDDGMPRLYCLIRDVISKQPFKIHISYLSSKTDSEFGEANWVNSGFTKSCGRFRVWHSDVVDEVNIFSHVLRKEKTGRGGCVRIYPRRGDIWAVYRNWSPEWNRSTPVKVRHQYEMVEVLDEYSEELGTCVVPLVKVDGFKTVYQKNTSEDAIRSVPRREMFRFSHRVPSWLINGEASTLPEKCWDLDPAAIPEELLQAGTESTT